MPELKSTYIGELKIEVTGTYMLGGSPHGQRRLDRLDKGHFQNCLGVESMAAMTLAYATASPSF